MTNTTQTISSLTLAQKALSFNDRADIAANNGGKLTIAAMMLANTDITFEDGIMIADYYDYGDSKKRKMLWREEIFTKVFQFESMKEVEDRNKKMVEYVQPIFTYLIKEGYSLIITEQSKKLDMRLLSDERKIVLDIKTMQLYLPKAIAIMGEEAINDGEALTLIETGLNAIARKCKKYLGLTSNTTVKPSNSDSITTDTIDYDNAPATLQDATAPKLSSVLKTTLNIIKMQELTTFDSNDRLTLLDIAKHIINQLDDDARLELLNNENISRESSSNIPDYSQENEAA